LLDALSRARAGLENPDEIERSARLVAQEVLKATPNRITITGVLSGICSAVKSLIGMATAAEAFKAAILALIG
jgi:hypothetical protein